VRPRCRVSRRPAAERMSLFVVNDCHAIKDGHLGIRLAKLVMGFIYEGSNILRVFYLKLVSLQNLVNLPERHRVGHDPPVRLGTFIAQCAVRRSLAFGCMRRHNGSGGGLGIPSATELLTVDGTSRVLAMPRIIQPSLTRAAIMAR
jgi:hypothetical protein